VTTYLLDQQLKKLEQDFLKEGGLRERMTRARLQRRAEDAQLPKPEKKKDGNDQKDKRDT